jgi:hypothetical protein
LEFLERSQVRDGQASCNTSHLCLFCSILVILRIIELSLAPCCSLFWRLLGTSFCLFLLPIQRNLCWTGSWSATAAHLGMIAPPAPASAACLRSRAPSARALRAFWLGDASLRKRGLGDASLREQRAKGRRHRLARTRTSLLLALRFMVCCAASSHFKSQLVSSK